jgi:hypothetical protein
MSVYVCMLVQTCQVLLLVVIRQPNGTQAFAAMGAFVDVIVHDEIKCSWCMCV